MNAKIPLPIAHYVRSSSTKACSPLSIEAQRHVLAEYATKHFGQSWTLHEVYEDRASGLTLDRPGLRRMLLDARKHLFGHLFVHRMDRLSRKPAHMAFVLEELSSSGVCVRSASEPFDLSAASGRLVSQMIGVFAEFEVRQKCERTMMGLAQRVRSGGYFGSKPPYGYDLAPGMRLVVNEAQAETVRRIFALFLEEGLGSTTIAARLTEEGRTQRNGRRWRPVSVRDVLRSPLVAGMVRIYDVCYAGIHEPIIPRGEFLQAQDVMNARSRALGIHTRRPARRHLLRGILRCGLCGRSMHVGVGGDRHGARARPGTTCARAGEPVSRAGRTTCA